jgi:hypothetical protein
VTRKARQDGNLSLSDFMRDAQGTLDGGRVGKSPDETGAETPDETPEADETTEAQEPTDAVDEPTDDRRTLQCCAENATTGKRCSNSALDGETLCGLHVDIEDVRLVPMGPEAPSA